MGEINLHIPEGRKLQIRAVSELSLDRSIGFQAEHRRQDFHSIIYLKSGKSTHEIDFEPLTIEGNQVLIVPRGTVYREGMSHELNCYFVSFTDEFFSDIQRQLLNGLLYYAMALGKLVIPIDPKELEAIEYYFKLLDHEQYLTDNQNQTFLLQNLMLALLNKLEGLIQDVPGANTFINIRKPFQRFIELVDQFYTQHQALTFYTQHLQLTSRKLNSISRQMIGLTATQYITDRIMISAKRSLCFTEKSIKEIATDLGYENQYYFSRVFKKRTGYSPEQFRGLQAE